MWNRILRGEYGRKIMSILFQIVTKFTKNSGFKLTDEDIT